MGNTTEYLEITGDIMVSFKVKSSGNRIERVVSDDSLYEIINKNVCEALEDLGMEIEKSKIYNFDIYKELEE